MGQFSTGVDTLHIAITPQLTCATFYLDDCRALAPSNVSALVERLLHAGVIIDVPARAKADAYFIHDGSLQAHRHRLVYRLTPDEAGTSAAQVLDMLSQRVFANTQQIFHLWLDYAQAEAMCYLHVFCRKYRLELDDDPLRVIESTVRSALETYSIKQIWFVLWKVVKDAASLASHEYYTRAKASATIPGKIQRYLEKVKKEDLTIRQDWERPYQQAAGTLGMLFSDFFEFDEDTPGIVVATQLSKLLDQGNAQEDAAKLADPIRRLIATAVLNDTGSALLFKFADLIREGCEVGTAIEELLAASRDA